MRTATRSSVDTISDLPCNVLDGILGCLPLKDAVKTSILSRDWRYKWVTRQELEFDYQFFVTYACNQATAIIYQVLLLHKGPILKFSLGGSNLTIYPDIDHWILFLSKKNVQEFTLCGNSLNNRYHLPSHFFTFHHLRHLKVDRCSFHPPPGFKGFEKLINLDLHFATFDPAILGNLIFRCPLLERLTLRWCTNFDTLEIDAPNLKCFDFRGNSKSICFKNAPMLEKLIVHLNSRVSMVASPVCSNITKFFCHMPCLMQLDISGHLLEYLTMGGLPENHLTALNNVKSFSVRAMFFRSIKHVSGVIYLITSFPKLQNLTIECGMKSEAVEPVVQYLQNQSSLCGAVKLLQKVHMSMFSGREVEMEFLRLILVSAPVLEEISAWNYEHLLCLSGREIMDNMKQYQRASPNVKFIVDEIVVEDALL
ncbi:F-box/FBD/LRR-repeat protein At1g13570-like [Solanum tuberosum]|nr:PREDICTED: F-box/FBD/LRR-repeat protein At1g13570-like [Solanum tuberosum]